MTGGIFDKGSEEAIHSVTRETVLRMIGKNSAEFDKIVERDVMMWLRGRDFTKFVTALLLDLARDVVVKAIARKSESIAAAVDLAVSDMFDDVVERVVRERLEAVLADVRQRIAKP